MDLGHSEEFAFRYAMYVVCCNNTVDSIMSGAACRDPFYQYSVLCSGGMIYVFLIFISESWMVEVILGGCSIIVLHSVMSNAPFTFTMGEGIALSTVGANFPSRTKI